MIGPAMPSAAVRRLTLKDIAREAGVATGTVSMVLNDSPRVASATRSHVQHVIRDLGYVHDRGAGQLRSKRSHLVGIAASDLLNPALAELTAALQHTLAGLGLLSIVGSCGGSLPRQRQFLDKLREYNVEGLLLMPAAGTSKAQLARLHAGPVPVVQVGSYVPGVPTDYVGCDHRRGAVMATQHLLALGHQHIAFIGLDPASVAAREGFDGFVQALQAAGLAATADLLVSCPATREAGHQAIARLFAPAARRPTALVCNNALLALGAMSGLHQRGITPGPGCAVVGLDDVAEAALCDPPLTTIHFDATSIGQAAAQLLARRIDNPQQAAEHLVLQPRLRLRASCGAPASASALPRRRVR